MKFKNATERDINKIVSLELKSNYRWTENRKKEQSNVKELFEKGKIAYLIFEKEILLGYIFFEIQKDKFFLDVVSLNKKFQGKGFGTKIMSKIISLAKRRKCKEFILEVWAKNNPAIKLYNKFNFKVTQIKRRHYKNGDDKLVMKLKL